MLYAEVIWFWLPYELIICAGDNLNLQFDLRQAVCGPLWYDAHSGQQRAFLQAKIQRAVNY